MKDSIEHNRNRAAKRHPLHLKIGDFLERTLTDCKLSRDRCILIRDEACGGNQQIPLFIDSVKSRKSEYCNVDLLILCDNKIRVIVEIEESNVKPTQVCGKFLTSAMSRYYIHESMKNIPIMMDDEVTFIQFVDTSKLKRGKTSKIEQWKNIEKSILDIIPVKNSKINHYKIFDTNEADMDNEEKRKIIKKYLCARMDLSNS